MRIYSSLSSECGSLTLRFPGRDFLCGRSCTAPNTQRLGRSCQVFTTSCNTLAMNSLQRRCAQTLQSKPGLSS